MFVQRKYLLKNQRVRTHQFHSGIHLNKFSYNSSNNILLMVKKSELEIWSLQIRSFQRIPARNCVLVLLEHHQSTQHGS